VQALHDLAVPELERADDVTATHAIALPHLREYRLERREHPAVMLD
jgi:hypothetical protein